jgi:predicted transcriptional regulator YdeE
LTIEEGKFAFVVHQGSVEDMSNTVKKFYGEVLPSSGLVRRKGMDLEIYSELDQNGSPSKIIVAAPVQ